MALYDVEKLPSTFRFPDAKAFATQTTGALQHLGFDSEFLRNNLVAPMQSQVNGLITAIEATAQKSISQVAMVLSGTATSLETQIKAETGLNVSAYASKITGMVGALVDGRVEVGLQMGAQLALQVAGDLVAKFAPALMECIPIIGAMISAVISTIMGFGAPSDQENAERSKVLAAKFSNAMYEMCPKHIAVPSPTTGASPSAADVFRDVYIAATIGDMLPLSVASVYVLLCGGESQGVGLTRREYNAWLNKERKRKKTIGVPQFVQQRMWSLIKAIMSATKDARLTAKLDLHGDQGASAFAQLQDVVRSARFRGQWDEASIDSIGQFLGALVGGQDRDLKLASDMYIVGDCSSFMPGVWSRSFHDSQINWQSQLASFCEETGPKGCVKWRSMPSATQLSALNAKRKARGVVGALVIDHRHATSLAETVMPFSRRHPVLVKGSLATAAGLMSWKLASTLLRGAR